jgi:hypothetical protein
MYLLYLGIHILNSNICSIMYYVNYMVVLTDILHKSSEYTSLYENSYIYIYSFVRFLISTM